MIAYIKGELVETLPGSVILDVHGIGYRIYISGRESEQLTKMGSQVRCKNHRQSTGDRCEDGEKNDPGTERQAGSGGCI